MTTPKELADKAKDALFAIDDYIARVNGDDRGGDAGVEQLRATIDQLQAMAEARQGSGEPVAWVAETADGRKRIELPGHVSGMDAAYGFKRTPLYTAPPSAGNRTHIADLIDTFEQLRKIVGTPEQDADALIAAVRALATPPSAQQATGSGQVLPWASVSERLPDWTDDNSVRVLVYTEGYDFGGQQVFDIPAADFHLRDDDGELGSEETRCASHWIYRDDVIALAAAAQAQPEVPAGWKLVPVEPTFDMKVAMDDAWFDNDSGREARVYKAALHAAPTTGKREPLKDEQIDSAAWAGGLTCLDGSCAFVPGTDLRPHIRALVRALHGITGEQRKTQCEHMTERGCVKAGPCSYPYCIPKGT